MLMGSQREKCGEMYSVAVGVHHLLLASADLLVLKHPDIRALIPRVPVGRRSLGISTRGQ